MVSLNNSNPCKISKSLFDLWMSKKLFDVCFVINDEKYFAHKLAILAYCKRFQSLLTETKPTELVEIHLRYSTNQGLKAILNFIYTSKILISFSNVAHILVTANELGIQELLEDACKFIEINVLDSKSQRNNNFHLKKIGYFSDVLSILQPTKIRKKEVYKIIANYLAENFQEFLKTDEFLNLSHVIICEFLRNYKLSINKESDLFEALINWLHTDESRFEFHEQIFTLINFESLNPNDIANYVNNYDFLTKNKILKEKIDKALEKHGYKTNDYYMNQNHSNKPGLHNHNIISIDNRKLSKDNTQLENELHKIRYDLKQYNNFEGYEGINALDSLKGSNNFSTNNLILKSSSNFSNIDDSERKLNKKKLKASHSSSIDGSSSEEFIELRRDLVNNSEQTNEIKKQSNDKVKQSIGLQGYLSKIMRFVVKEEFKFQDQQDLNKFILKERDENQQKPNLYQEENIRDINESDFHKINVLKLTSRISEDENEKQSNYSPFGEDDAENSAKNDDAIEKSQYDKKCADKKIVGLLRIVDELKSKEPISENYSNIQKTLSSLSNNKIKVKPTPKVVFNETSGSNIKVKAMKKLEFKETKTQIEVKPQRKLKFKEPVKTIEIKRTKAYHVDQPKIKIKSHKKLEFNPTEDKIKIKLRPKKTNNNKSKMQNNKRNSSFITKKVTPLTAAIDSISQFDSQSNCNLDNNIGNENTNKPDPTISAISSDRIDNKNKTQFQHLLVKDMDHKLKYAKIKNVRSNSEPYEKVNVAYTTARPERSSVEIFKCENKDDKKFELQNETISSSKKTKRNNKKSSSIPKLKVSVISLDETISAVDVYSDTKVINPKFLYPPHRPHKKNRASKINKTKKSKELKS